MHTVTEQFPYYKSSSYVNRAYIHNLIWMSKYLPTSREQIMMTIINKLVPFRMHFSTDMTQKKHLLVDGAVTIKDDHVVHLAVDCLQQKSITNE